MRPLLVSLRFLPWVVVLSALVLSLRMGARTAWSALKGHPAFAVTTENVSVEVPVFVNEGPMNGLLRDRLSGLLEDAHIFDRGLADAVREELRLIPWITEVRDVRTMLPNSLRLSLQFRKPAGKIRFANQDHLVDRDGYWLPPDLYREPREWADEMPLIVHEGLPDHFPPRGRPWDARALAAGARLAQFLHESGGARILNITTINVTRAGVRTRDWESPDIHLLTSRGVVIGWGTTEEYDRIPGLNRRVDEPSDERKLRELIGFHAANPGLAGVKNLDLRFNRITYGIIDDM